MRKRVLSVLLVIALLIAVGIVAAQADPEYTPDQIVTLSAAQTFTGTEPVEAPCYACGGEMKQWQPITAATHIAATGHYFLANDITATNDNALYIWGVGVTACVHQNGKTIMQPSNRNQQAIAGLKADGILNLMGGGLIKSTSSNGTIHCEAGAINVYGSTIENYGGHQYCTTVTAGTVSLYGVTATTMGVSAAGGNLNIESGNINKITVTGGQISLSGAPTVAALDMSAATTMVDATGLTGGSINVSAVDGVFTTPFDSDTLAKAAIPFFVAGGNKAVTVADGNVLSCGVKTYTPANTIAEKIAAANKQTTDGLFGTEAVEDYCYVCNQPVTWQPITAATHIATTGHYFLANDITATNDNALYIWGVGVTACVHQNGKTIMQPSDRNQQAIAGLKADGILNLMGGGLIKSTSSNGTIHCEAGAINVYGSTIENYGGHQHCTTVTAGTVSLYGVTATTMGVSAAGGNLNIESGNINKITVTGGQISLSGAPTVAALDMSAATTVVDATGLTGGSVNVSTVDGVFTTPFDSNTLAKAAIPFFVAGGNKAVTVADGNVLSCGVKTYTPANTIAEKIEKSNAQRFEGTEPVDDYCYVCNKPVTWQPIIAATHIAATGHYFLTDNISGDASYALYIWGATEACVHQNGKTISSGNSNAVANIKSATILNIMGGGRIENASARGTLYTIAGATLNIYGATVHNAANKQYATELAGGVIGLYGVDASGSGVVVDAAAGELNIHSGSFNKINITGCQVSLSGAPTVAALDMSAATTKINAKGLTGGSINVSAVDGVFTTPFDSDALAKAAIPFFVGGSKTISATDEYALKCEVKTYTPANTIAEKIEKSNAQRFDGTEAVADYCYVCNKEVTWQPITAATNISNGHYFLANDITRGGGTESALYTWGDAGTVCLHLNGKTVTHTGSLAAIQSMDARTSVFNVMGGGRLENMSSSYGALASSANSTLNVYGGSVENGAGRQYCTTITSGTVNLYNVEASTNEVSATAGTINIESGSFRAITITAGQVNLSGTPVVGTLDASAATVLPDLTGVTGGEINIGATEGVFTTAFATPEAAAAVAKFVYAPEKIIVVDGDALSTADAAAAVVNGNDQKAYATYAAAEAAYTNGYIKLLADDNIEITENVTIDFNGQSVEVAGSSELTGFDSTTQGRFYVEPASIKIANTITTVLVPETENEETLTKGYLAVTDDYGITTFSYYEMKLSGVALKANKDTVGLYYKGTWNFNDYLPAGKVEAGVVVNVQDQNNTPFANGFRSNKANGYYSAPAESIENGEPVTSILVNDIMKADRNDAALNSQYGQMKIKAAAFITVNGQDIITGIKNLSVCDVLKLIEGNDAAYAANETKLANFYETWKTLANLDTWGLTKIGK